MIDFIRGTVRRKDMGLVVLEAGGIGYALCVSARTASAAPAADSEMTLYTRLCVREDEITLFGFETLSERACFDELTGVSGVGPKAALAILSDLTPDRFALAVAAGDYKQLTRIKGIGNKTAQRIVLELKDKIAKEADFEGAPARIPDSGARSEALSALLVLGYSQSEAAMALEPLDESLPASELIRLSLARLGRAKFG